MQKNNPILQSIRNQPLAWMVQGVGVVFFVGNLFLASELFPLIRQLDSLVGRVQAVEKVLDDRTIIVERFIQLEERNKTIFEDITQMKNDIRDLLIIHGQR